MTTKPEIRPLPSEADIKRYIDELITPERADREAMMLCELILLIANPEDDMVWHLANIAAQHAYSKTEAYQDAYHKFARFAAKPGPERKEKITEISQEM